MTDRAEVSIVLVSFNTRDLLRECLENVRRETRDFRAQILVVDNASADGSVEMMREEFPEVEVIPSEINLGFAGANNVALERVEAPLVVLLNTDAFFEEGALALAVEKMRANERVGLAGARLISRDGSDQPSARMFPTLMTDLFTLTGLAARFPDSRLFGRFDRTWADNAVASEVDWVPGAFSILRSSVLDEVGLFDEAFFLYYEEVDLCRRIKDAGHEIWYWPDVVVMHVGGESAKTLREMDFSNSGSQLTLWRMRSALLYYRKHHGFVGGYLARLTEVVWHQLRALRNRFASDSLSVSKARESRALARLMNVAWQETSGGRVSPPRPW
ncbi:MAG: glycosyltransferase family 2 protein [Acidobacteriota bacterium]